MSSFRKKSSSSTDETSSTSFSGSTSSSGSSSGSDSGSSSSDTESSSTLEEKRQTQAKTNDSMQKSQVITRRKSSEVKTSSKTLDSEKKATPSTKLRSTNNMAQRLSRSNEFSSEDEIPPSKKPTRLLNNSTIAVQRKKTAQKSTSHQQSPLNGGGGKAPPAVVKQHHQQNFSSKASNKINVPKECSQPSTKADEAKQNINFSSVASSEHSDSEFLINKKLERKLCPKPNCTNKTPTTSKIKTVASRTLPKRNFASKTNSRLKSSDESESESGSTSGDGSSSTSETDQSESSNSSASQAIKKSTAKRSLDPNTDELGVKHATKDRKLTRSLSTRRSKHFLGRGVGDASDTDSDLEGDVGKYSFSKSPTKKVPTNVALTKTSTIKECTIDKPRSQSPQFSLIEKKCAIEGCDSSGHLSGNQDKHFLAEACPIFHNMSASECKERANDRIQREEFRKKTGSQQESVRKSLSAEQKEFLTKIRESRARFRPIQGSMNTDKIKVEKDCQDDDREPSLSGLVPDYDLQLFREAQAIASEKIEEELSDLPVGKGIKYITMGKYKMKVWYQSPYPDDAARLPKMYICEFCLRYQKSETGIKRHAQKCVWRHPPGDEIYRKGKLQVWQVDGKRHKQYCQHLCLLAKFFLDHKTLYYDVEPFLFYIMTLADVDGCHTVGYFSKEKNSFYNVSCILTLPPYQRKGYGRLLIDFSYLLTRVEGKIGSPEKPLSDLGLISYRSYWKDVLLDYLCNRSGSTLSIKDVSQEMAIYSYDIVSTLQALGMMKYWKGKHIVLKKQDVLDEYEERVKRRGNFPKIDDSCLRWSPFVPPQTNAST